MKAVFVKHLDGLQAADDDATSALSKIKLGAHVMVEIRRPRNIRHHRLLFALLRVVVENTDRYETKEELLDALKIATGHCKKYPSVDRSLVFVRPLSISFEAMDQVEFASWFGRVVDVVITQVIPGMDRDDLAREIFDMTNLTY